MAFHNTCGTFGRGSGTPCGSKRPSESPIEGTGSVKRPRVLFGVAGDASASPATNLFGSRRGSNEKPFGGADTSAAATGGIFGSNYPSGARPFGGANNSASNPWGLFGTPASSNTGRLLEIPTPAASPYVYGAPIPWGYLAPAHAFPPTPNGGFLGSSNSSFPFNNPPWTVGPRAPLFGPAASFTRPNDTPQVVQGTPDSATPSSAQGLAPPQDKTSKEVEVIATQVRDLQRRLDTIEKGANHANDDTTPARPQENPTPASPLNNPTSPHPHESPTPAKGFLAWLKQLDLRSPEGFTNWKKAEVGITDQSLVSFGNIEFILVTRGCLHHPFQLEEDIDKGVKLEEGAGFVQEICRNGCVELAITEGGKLPTEIPKYLLELGSVYSKPVSSHTSNPPSMVARLYMDISKPSKPLWLVRVGLGNRTDIPFSRIFNLGDAGSVTFDVAKLVGDMRTLKPAKPSRPILANQQQVPNILKNSARLIVGPFQNGKLIKPNASELEAAIRTGWAVK
ncbi:hypothetical protein PG984_002775 [Apiospora sp. TS-2023a]